MRPAGASTSGTSRWPPPRVDHPHQRRRRAAVCPADGAAAAGVRRPLQPQRGDADARRAVGAGADADQQHRPAQPHMPNAAAPRRLRAIILTLPSAMPKPEREIFRRRMQGSDRAGVEGPRLAPQDAPFDGAHARFPVPQVQMEWDEATCGQMVYLYNETQVNFAGRTDAFSPPWPGPTGRWRQVSRREKRCASPPSTSAAAPGSGDHALFARRRREATTSKSTRACCSRGALKSPATISCWTPSSSLSPPCSRRSKPPA